MTVDDALKMVAERARLMKAQCASGATGMMAAKMGSAQMTETLKSDSKYSSLVIACYNRSVTCPDTTILTNMSLCLAMRTA